MREGKQQERMRAAGKDESSRKGRRYFVPVSLVLSAWLRDRLEGVRLPSSRQKACEFFPPRLEEEEAGVLDPAIGFFTSRSRVSPVTTVATL